MHTTLQKKPRARRHPHLLLLLTTSLLLTASLPHLWRLTRHPLPRSNEPSPPPARDADLAYFIQIANSTAQLVPRLLSRLYHVQNIYVLHFDTKVSNATVRDVMNRIHRAHPAATNIHLLHPQIVSYAGISMVLNTLSAITYCLSLQTSWDYFINLSAGDYPLIPHALPRRLLGKHLHALPNYLQFGRHSAWREILRHRGAHLKLDDVLTRSQNGGVLRELPLANPMLGDTFFEPAYGSAWMMISRSFAQYAATSHTARRMLLAFGYMRSVPEHFFVSLAYNEPVFNASICGTAFRTDVWEHEGRKAGQHPYFLDERDTNGTYIFEEKLGKVGGFLARKFRERDSPIMDLLDRQAENVEHSMMVEREFDVILRRWKTSS